MQKLEKLYEGKAKMVFRTDDPELLIVEYKDDATAFNGEKQPKHNFLKICDLEQKQTRHKSQ